MSIRQRNLVRDLRLRGSKHRYLDCLADFADDHGHAFPGLSLIVDHTRLSKPTLRRLRAWAIQEGYLRVRSDDRGRARYHLTITERQPRLDFEAAEILRKSCGNPVHGVIPGDHQALTSERQTLDGRQVTPRVHEGSVDRGTDRSVSTRQVHNKLDRERPAPLAPPSSSAGPSEEDRRRLHMLKARLENSAPQRARRHAR